MSVMNQYFETLFQIETSKELIKHLEISDTRKGDNLFRNIKDLLKHLDFNVVIENWMKSILKTHHCEHAFINVSLNVREHLLQRYDWRKCIIDQGLRMV